MIEALAIFGQLESITRQSLVPAAQAAIPLMPSPSPPQMPATPPRVSDTSSAKPVVPAKPAPKAQYGTARSAYRAALKDPSLIDALLAMRKHPGRPGDASSREQNPWNQFSKESVPEVQAAPKASPIQRKLGSIKPILR